MRVKKYTANTMPEALQVIRKELGREAVILKSREVRKKGIFRFFNKKNIEVIAAVDPEPIAEKDNKVKASDFMPPLEQSEKVKIKDSSQDEILTELNYLKDMLQLQAKNTGEKLSPDYQLALNELLDQEVDKGIANEIIESVLIQAENEPITDRNQMKDRIKNVIQNKLNYYQTKQKFADNNIIQFVGPTGVGKTTTIAKVAAKLILDDAKKVAFITTDTYRIAAIEQLRTYARILNIPVEVAYNAEDYQYALSKLKEYDVILVDTAGRNFRDTSYVRELEENMGETEITTYLVLALTAKPKDLEEIYDKFQQIPIEAVIFTKLDETTQFGSILNIVSKKQVGVAYLTNGQDVPENIQAFKAEEISSKIAGEVNE